MQNNDYSNEYNTKCLLTFIAIAIFYFFEAAQMSYFNILAPYYLHHDIYNTSQIGSLSAAYYYGNMLGLIPVAFTLDHYSLRKILLWAILGSIVGAFMLLASSNFELQWIARFICGFFGGAFSFVGGIRVLASLYKKRFSLFIGLFIAVGMLGGLLCQYPLLLTVNKLGPDGAMTAVASFGIIVGIINYLYLHPPVKNIGSDMHNKYNGTFVQMCLEILKNWKNWLDCFLVVLLDTPVSMIGTLWGIVLFVGYYHFSPEVSSWLVMSLFAGLVIGSPLSGIISDRYNHSRWIIVLGASGSALMLLAMMFSPNHTPLVIGVYAFFLGLFSSTQALGFTWLTKNMKPELIGRNSAFNSMIFMGTNGLVKQYGAYLIVSVPLVGVSSTGNILMFVLISMFIAVAYALVRDKLFFCSK